MAQSPQPLVGPPQKRISSASQRGVRSMEEGRIDRVHVTTRETLTSRTRSPERRPGPSTVSMERPKPVASLRTDSKDTSSKASKGDLAQGMSPNSP